MKAKFFQIIIFKFFFLKNKYQKQPGRKEVYPNEQLNKVHMSSYRKIFFPSKQREAIMIKFDKDKVTYINYPIGPCNL